VVQGDEVGEELQDGEVPRLTGTHILQRVPRVRRLRDVRGVCQGQPEDRRRRAGEPQGYGGGEARGVALRAGQKMALPDVREPGNRV